MSSDESNDIKYYLVYRKADNGYDEFFGWSANKSIVNAFMKQRDNKKYFVEKIEMSGSQIYYCRTRKTATTQYLDLTPELMIDILPLQSCQSSIMVKFFTNEEEKERIVRNIKIMFDALRSFDRIEDESIIRMVTLYNGLKNKYLDALNIIGYQPKEIDYIYDDVDDPYNDKDDGLDANSIDMKDEYSTMNQKYSQDPSKIMIYSLESVIKVLKEHL